jgi:hypothetical protein
MSTGIAHLGLIALVVSLLLAPMLPLTMLLMPVLTCVVLGMRRLGRGQGAPPTS